MPDLGASELFVLALAALALFGYRKLPDAARSLGRAVRGFRAESAGVPAGDVRAKAEAPTVRGPLGARPTDGERPPAGDPPPAG
ncbi:MAG: twin-arginine translocase TatA/TatE family subunit [Actinobacteria bacterium]|nr:twin-arginine translocase TatA/TatE family subunit [Actinomycetota bacterium]